MNAAIVIGCSRYDRPAITDLSYAHADARRIADLLAETCDVAPANALVLSDDAPSPDHLPTRANIIDALASPPRGAPIETLFFCFSGHGFRSPAHDVDYLLARDTVPTALEETAVSFEAARRYLQRWQPRRVVLLLDACRAVEEGVKSVTLQTRELSVEALYPHGLLAFSSCHPGQRSYEIDELRSGIFTHAVCEGLGDEGGCKTGHELSGYLAERVPALADLYGKPPQDPYVRVEPDSLLKAPLVAERVLHVRTARTPIGPERRAYKAGGRAARVERDVVCAVDFGTSYSGIAYRDGDAVELAPAPDGKRMVPSVVAVSPDLEYVVGWPAVAAQNEPGTTILRNVKRSLGGDEAHDVGGLSVPPELAASLILRSLRQNAEEYLHASLSSALVSVPANFSIRQSNSLVRAFELAGIEISRLITEPAAAAILLADRSRSSGRDVAAAVVDLGGGTFDVCSVDVGGVRDDDRVVVIEVVDIAGDDHLGGVDYDEAVAEYALEQVARLHPEWEPSPLELAQLRVEAERVKVELALAETTAVVLREVELDGSGLTDLRIPIDRETFRGLTRALDARIGEIFAAVEWPYRDDQEQVVQLAGQGAKIFTVAEQIRAAYPGREVVSLFHEAAVVTGLGRYLHVFAPGVTQDELRAGNVLLLDGMPTAIGVKCSSFDDDIVLDPQKGMEQVYDLLPAATTVPTSSTSTVRLVRPVDAPVAIEVVERRGHTREDDLDLCRIDVDPAGAEMLELVVVVDENRTIVLSVSNELTGDIAPYQLNNHFLEPRFYSKLDGYGTRPLAKVGEGRF